jgi:hypothetical protein
VTNLADKKSLLWAAFAKDLENKKAAEAMASEKLGHVAALERSGAAPITETQVPEQSDVTRGHQVDTGILERCLATYLTELERRLEGASVNCAR